MPHAHPVGSAATETSAPTSLAFWKKQWRRNALVFSGLPRWVAMAPHCKVIKGVKPGKRRCYSETGLWVQGAEAGIMGWQGKWLEHQAEMFNEPQICRNLRYAELVCPCALGSCNVLHSLHSLGIRYSLWGTKRLSDRVLSGSHVQLQSNLLL